MPNPRLWLIIILLLLSFAAHADPQVLITNVRIQPDINQTRVSFELTQKTVGKVKLLSHPNRLLVEFYHARKNFTLQHTHLKDPLITSIKDDSTLTDTVRMTFYLVEPVRWNIRYINNKRINTVNFQLDLIGIKQKKRSAFQQHIVDLISSIAETANSNIVRQDELAQARRDKKLNVVKAKLVDIARKTNKTFIIVIDPGHGGKDTGAIGAYGIAEKMVVLNISKMLAKKINAMPGMRAILTRDNDSFIPLRTRLKLARKGDADLFIAIHADAYFQKNATGASVYALSKRGATSEASRWLAQKQNYSELDDIELGELKDHSQVLRSVLIDLAQTMTIRDSVSFGNDILNALEKVTTLKYKRVEQAPFVVLKSPDIPSILVETGFISNPNEEKRLASSYYQGQIADALAKGIKNFIDNQLINAQ